ncbi:hypothetical protein [Paenibacillus monticola]|uniref:Uncharacterized protein n=1 Tax=Paenibacillus monticola TaxID=2666075 RepID=A0A7X2H7M4_9BACL|nr:hypothetical protein [Paenibacillus monticola]MRN54945.1 hypothetical protein [Paenibacillus monticola]
MLDDDSLPKVLKGAAPRVNRAAAPFRSIYLEARGIGSFSPTDAAPSAINEFSKLFLQMIAGFRHKILL